MRKSRLEATYRANVQAVWDIVTDNQNYSWRSDLLRVEVALDGRAFVEYTKKGFQTNFIITEKEPCKKYAFDMENQSFKGRWTGLFEETPQGGTKITFFEELWIKNLVIELLSYIGMPLQKIQRQYAEDLRRALGEE